MFELAAGTKQGRPRDTGGLLGTGAGLDDVPGSGQGNEPGTEAPGSTGLLGGSLFSDFLFALLPPQPFRYQQNPKYSSAGVLLLQAVI